MIIKAYSPPIMQPDRVSQIAEKPAYENNISRCISHTQNSSHDIKTRAEEISLKYDLLGDDILCNTPGIEKNQQERLHKIGMAITALEHAAKLNMRGERKERILDATITEKIKNICEAFPVNKNKNFKHDNAYALRGSEFFSDFVSSKKTSVDKISYAQLLNIGEKMREKNANPASIDSVAINKFSDVWNLRTKLSQH